MRFSQEQRLCLVFHSSEHYLKIAINLVRRKPFILSKRSKVPLRRIVCRTDPFWCFSLCSVIPLFPIRRSAQFLESMPQQQRTYNLRNKEISALITTFQDINVKWGKRLYEIYYRCLTRG